MKLRDADEPSGNITVTWHTSREMAEQALKDSGCTGNESGSDFIVRIVSQLAARERELRWACTQLLELGELYRKAIPTDRAQAILTTLPQETP